jgi:hypothetical protein
LFINGGERIVCGKPSPLSINAFRPSFALAPHQEGENLHFAQERDTHIGLTLFVSIDAE